MNLAVIGLPGAGKSTQAKKLSDEFNLVHITISDVLQENCSYLTKKGETIGEMIDTGQEVPPSTTAQLLSTYLDNLNMDGRNGVILDGYPRTKNHAAEAEKLLEIDIVLIIEINDEFVFERLTKRRVCVECGARFHLDFNPPEEDGECDSCESELVQREDDTRHVIKNRLSWQKDGILEVMEQYQEHGTVIRIDGTQSIEEVWEKIKREIRDVHTDFPSG